jgi:hypothetical protein
MPASSPHAAGLLAPDGAQPGGSGALASSILDPRAGTQGLWLIDLAKDV